MCAVSWNEKSNPSLLIADINRVQRENSGRVKYRDIGHYEWVRSALLSAVKFDRDIPDSVAASFVSSALSCPTTA
jgi:hypothetical protein